MLAFAKGVGIMDLEDSRVSCPIEIRELATLLDQNQAEAKRRKMQVYGRLHDGVRRSSVLRRLRGLRVSAGHHRVHVDVMLPQRLSDEQRRLLAEFEASVGEDTYRPDDSLLGRIRSAFS